MRTIRNVLVTGGCGFIASNLILYLLQKEKFRGKIINVDKLTYAGNPDNLKDISQDPRYLFFKEDICNTEAIKTIVKEYKVDTIIHTAAETHVDNSIAGPKPFIDTNIYGTFSILETVRTSPRKIHLHIMSSDEVFGALGPEGQFYENTAYAPKNPYSASKASADMLVRAYANTYGISTTISNCSNNYGPRQFPEKLIPKLILNALEEKDLPIYGKGLNIRDWIYVEDHASAIWKIIKEGNSGESYNVGGDTELTNITIAKVVCLLLEEFLEKPEDYYAKLIKFVKDRPGHDQRYAINCEKLKKKLRWKQEVDFETGIRKTVKWYLDNMWWVDRIKSGAYKINFSL